MRRLAVLSSSTVFAQGLAVAAMPVLTRLYTPEAFGLYAAFSSLFATFSIAAALRYDAAIPIAPSEQEAIATVWLSLLAAIGTGLVLMLLIWPAHLWLARWSNLGTAPDLLLWLAPSIMIYGVMLAFDGWITYRGALKAMVLTKIGQPASLATAQLGLGLAVGGPEALVAGLAFSYVVDLLCLLWAMTATDRRLLRAFRPDGLKALARRNWRFPLLAAPSALLDSAGKAMLPLLLALFYDPATAGLYSLAQRVVGLPLRFLGSSASQLFMSEIARFARDDPRTLLALFTGMSRRFFLLGLAYLVPLAIMAPLLFRLVFGADWETSGHLLRPLLPMYLAMLVNNPTRSTLLFFHRQALVLGLDLASATGLVASFLVAWALGLGAGTAILLASCLLATVYTISWLTTFRLLRGLARSAVAGRPTEA